MVCFPPDKFFKMPNKQEIQWVFCLCKDLSGSLSCKSCSCVKLGAASALQHEQVTSFWSSGGELLKVPGARSGSSLLRNKHRIALQAVSISQPACGLWTASLNVWFFRGCPTKNTLDFHLARIACAGPGYLLRQVPMIRELKELYCCRGLCFIFSLFPRMEGMLDGSGSWPRAFFLLPEVFLDSVCSEMSRIIMPVQPDFHGQSLLGWNNVQLVRATLMYRRQ